MAIIRKRRGSLVASLLNVGFKEAIKYSEGRGVVLPSTYYTEMQDAARQQAFTVSGLSSLRQISSVLGALDETLRDGGTFESFTQRVQAGGVDLSPQHRETVFRTGVQSAYNAGRQQQQIANEADRQYLMYDAINDSRTRESHRAMDGFIAPVSHPVWLRWYPPNGFNCRCSVISLDERQAKARGYTGRVREPEVEPDDGFAASAGRYAAKKALGAAMSVVPAPIRRAVGRWVIRKAMGGSPSP